MDKKRSAGFQPVICSAEVRSALIVTVCLCLLAPAILPAQEIVEGGSPLYERAVKESVNGLVKRSKPKTAPAAGQPCKHCGKVHPPGQHGTPQPAAHASTPGKPCPKCGKIHAPAPLPSKPSVTNHVDSGAVLPSHIAKEYYYCRTCRKYHSRKETPPSPSSAPDATDRKARVPQKPE